MTILKTLTRQLLLAGGLIGLQACQTAPHDLAVAQPAATTGPALWKVADADTTIYLFGTVHALPKDVNWFSGPIARAVESADVLVTELSAEAVTDPASQQLIGTKAMLPPGQTLRSLLDAEQRRQYEAAMTKLGLPVQAFDPFEPWFAAMSLSMLPLMKAGYTAESGVEKVVGDNLRPKARRAALETLEQQISTFDTLPMDSQVAFLVATAADIDDVVPNMQAMVGEWSGGNADRLAALMNDALADPTLRRALLGDRNRRWAQWIAERLDQPGTVLVAVGAGHLAGADSVQVFLGERGLKVTRLQ